MEEPLPSSSRSVSSFVNTTKRGRKDFITCKLVATLDRCQLSIRDSVYIIQAVLETLDLSCDNYVINKSSIQRRRTEIRRVIVESIKSNFQNNEPEVVTVHWDGKLLPCLDMRSPKEESIIIISLDSSSGKNQASAVSSGLDDWNLNDKVKIMCCDTTASNTGRLNRTCMLLEQKLEKELILFACRHHVCELVLKSAFEAKIQQVTHTLDILLFKNFRENWQNINSSTFKPCTEFVKQLCDSIINELVEIF